MVTADLLTGQTELQASLQMTATVSKLSLVNYLAHPGMVAVKRRSAREGRRAGARRASPVWRHCERSEAALLPRFHPQRAEVASLRPQ
jgi:hypothetical protein